MGIVPAVIDKHGGEEGNDVKDHEDGDDPCVAAAAALRAGTEEAELDSVLELKSSSVSTIGCEWWWWWWWRRGLDFDMGLELAVGVGVLFRHWNSGCLFTLASCRKNGFLGWRVQLCLCREKKRGRLVISVSRNGWAWREIFYFLF